MTVEENRFQVEQTVLQTHLSAFNEISLGSRWAVDGCCLIQTLRKRVMEMKHPCQKEPIKR